MKCPICFSNFPINLMELSHDIPLYIGGVDNDGRRYLCCRCHDIYENIILFRCIREILKEGVLPRINNRKDRIVWMERIKNLSGKDRMDCWTIAYEIKMRFFHDTNTTKEP